MRPTALQLAGSTRSRDPIDGAIYTNSSCGPLSTGLPEYANPVRPAKRHRGPQGGPAGVWPEVVADEASRIFAEAGKAFASTPGNSSDEEQAMDLLVRLWSPASTGAADDPEFMSHLQHPPSNLTSPSTTSPVIDDVYPLDAPAEPLAHDKPPLAPASVASLPVAHAWPLPAHLQPGYAPPRSREPPPPPYGGSHQYRPPRGAPPPYGMPPRPLKLAPPGAVHGGIHRPPPPPRSTAPGNTRPLPLAQANVDLHRPVQNGAKPPHAAGRGGPPPHAAAYPPPPPGPSHAPRRQTEFHWHQDDHLPPQPVERRVASSLATRGYDASAPAPAPASYEWHMEAVPPPRSGMMGRTPALSVVPAAAHHHQHDGEGVARPHHMMETTYRHPSSMAQAPRAQHGAYGAVARGGRPLPPSASGGAPPHAQFVPEATLDGLDLAPAAAEPAVVAHASMLSSISFSMTLGGGSGRNLAERKEWTAEEDRQICKSVRKHGFKWRLVAADVPGRSDDAVRNRYNRVKDLEHVQPTSEELAVEAAEGGPAEIKPSIRRGRKLKPKVDKDASSQDDDALSSKGESGGSGSSHHSLSDEEKEKVERVSWSRSEDETIVRSVQELGNKWARIAERLSGRTEHAIRNRFARLQSLALRGNPIMLSSGEGLPIGIQLVPSTLGGV